MTVVLWARFGLLALLAATAILLVLLAWNDRT
jgi:hypothetical protein